MPIALSLRDLFEGAESLVYVEDMSSKKGFLQSINPLAKLAVTLFMIVASLFVPSLSYLAIMCTIPLFLSLVSKIPMKDFLIRTTLIPLLTGVISLPVLFITPGIPFLSANLNMFHLTVTFEGIQRFALFTIRVWFCVATLSLFILSTGFNAFMKLLSSLRIPSILIQMFSLTYRYLFLSIHEIQRVLIAKEARTYIDRRTLNIQNLKNTGALLATIFVRTYERSERVYMAMKSRGFEINNTKKSSISPLRIKDTLFTISTMTIFGLIIVL
jgi:cobalt/nickel transport system permease protein